jgi:uncharacterized membrane protein YkvA (DUF1232 family)
MVPLSEKMTGQSDISGSHLPPEDAAVEAVHDYGREYTEASFWRKIARYARQAGKEVVAKALILYYVFNDKDTPTWAKASIAAALGYFITPLDAIPDFAPMVGFADDLGALLTATAAIAANIKPEHKEMADRKVLEWFG